MAGIYFHIPYCKQACYYCDFHFSTERSTQNKLVECMDREIAIQKDFIAGEIETIYFGGGTPSLLTLDHLELLTNSIYKNFQVASSPEVTLECNPDDMELSYIQAIKSSGINRLSIGIQSLDNTELKLMNRAHDKNQAIQSIKVARQSGFDNLNLDIIFGIPGGSKIKLQRHLELLLQFEPEHFSTYGLTIEPRTVFGNWVSKGKLKEETDENSAAQFEDIMANLKLHGYDQYEISNFAKPGFESKHNSNYWLGKKYLGIGPGAHSFNGNRRQFNVMNNRKYIEALERNQLAMEFEDLSNTQMSNEYILTSLRTKWGCCLKVLQEKYNLDLLSIKKDYIEYLLLNEFIYFESDCIKLTDQGKLVADSITEELFQE